MYILGTWLLPFACGLLCFLFVCLFLFFNRYLSLTLLWFLSKLTGEDEMGTVLMDKTWHPFWVMAQQAKPYSLTAED